MKNIINQSNTIVALATPYGKGGVGIVRVSGHLSSSVAIELLGKIPQPRKAEYLPFFDNVGSILDKGIAIFFPAPHSFTGEDILECHGHGGLIILDLLLQRILSIPKIRLARPGEFSERAFLNNKLDLVQAESISDLINASSIYAARSAMKSLQGEFSIRIYKLVDALINLRIYIEASLDFPDEEIHFLSNNKIEENLHEIIINLNKVREEAHKGSVLREGITVVLFGKPNVGKSSLLNILSGREVAIVTDVAGTTRDILKEEIYIDGVPIHIVDTAGLRDVEDKVEQIAIDKTLKTIQQADHALLIIDSTMNDCRDPRILWTTCISNFSMNIPVTVICNKVDLTSEKIRIKEINGYSLITLSAKTGDGIDLLRKHLKNNMKFSGNFEGIFLARRRHLEALEVAEKHLFQGKKTLTDTNSYELLAIDLWLAQKTLNEITGEFRSNDLLEKIFSSFCIGK